MIQENILKIKNTLPEDVDLIAVSKTYPRNCIDEAIRAGQLDFGENKVQELIEKYRPDENIHWHMIGHLQTNKVKMALEVFDYIHSVDSLKLAEKTSEEAEKLAKVQKILIQINNAGEEQKFGFSNDEIFNKFGEIIDLKSIEVVGVMNMAPLGASDAELIRLFSEIREIKESLEKEFNCKMNEISMGMSQDYKIAAREGSTMLRIGRKLFNTEE